MPRRVRKLVLLYLLAFTASQATMAWALTDAIATKTILYSRDDHTLTVNIDRVPLREALQTLANQLPVAVTLKGFTGMEGVSATFTNLPLEQGLEQLLHGQDYAILYSRMPSSQQALPKEIIVLARSIIGENTTPPERIFVPSSRVSQLDAMASDQQYDKADDNQALSDFANTIETWAEQLDQPQTHGNSPLAHTMQDRNSDLTSLTHALIQHSESTTP